MADPLDPLGTGSLTHAVDPLIAPGTIATGDADLHQFMRGEGAVELGEHGVGQAILADAHYGIAVMGASAKKPDLPGGQHGTAPTGNGVSGTRILADPQTAFDEVKLDLGAIIVVAVIGAPLVMWALDGVAEIVLLGGYGCGAGLWLYCRTKGVLAAAHASRLERTGGPE